MPGSWFDSVRSWLSVGRNRGIVIGVAVLVAAVGAGLPSLLGGSGTSTLNAIGPTPTATPSVNGGTAEPTVTSSAGPRKAHDKKRAHASASPSAADQAPTTAPYQKTGGGDTTIADSGGNLDSGGSKDKYADLAMGRGVSRSAVSIGIAYDTNAAAAGAAFGVSVSDVDRKKQAKGVIDYINAHGGIAGRKIDPVWHAVDLTGGLHGSNEAQKTCDAFTQDATVFGVLGDAQSECLLQHKVVELNEAGGNDSYAQYPDYAYSPSAFTESRGLRALAQGLKADGFYSTMPSDVGCTASGPKLGAVIFDSDKDRQQPMVEAALASAGESVDKWGYVDNTSSNVQQIVLSFKQACVTHVLSPGYSPLLFANAAESQGYRPLYGVSSTQTPSLLAKNVNKNQLRNFHGVGWIPVADVDDAHDPGPLGDDAKLCLKIMRAQGLPTTRSDMDSAYKYCDEFFVLKVAFDHAKALTAHGFRLAYEAIGSWDSCVTFQVSLSAARHAGATGYRLLHYNASAGSFVYASGTKTVT